MFKDLWICLIGKNNRTKWAVFISCVELLEGKHPQMAKLLKLQNWCNKRIFCEFSNQNFLMVPLDLSMNQTPECSICQVWSYRIMCPVLFCKPLTHIPWKVTVYSASSKATLPRVEVFLVFGSNFSYFLVLWNMTFFLP